MPAEMNDDEANSHEAFMDLALAQADAGAALGEVPVGAVVVLDGKVIAAAHNRREVDQDPAGHAELIAMRQAAAALGTWRLEGCTVYVTLEPCAMCSGAMVLARIARCVYGCTDPKGGFLGTLDDLSGHPRLNHRFDVVSGVRADACAGRLKDFFKALRARRSSSP
jgi:tRNA(adenine34) deaminase